jgi:hypothetical protein
MIALLSRRQNRPNPLPIRLQWDASLSLESWSVYTVRTARARFLHGGPHGVEAPGRLPHSSTFSWRHRPPSIRRSTGGVHNVLSPTRCERGPEQSPRPEQRPRRAIFRRGLKQFQGRREELTLLSAVRAGDFTPANPTLGRAAQDGLRRPPGHTFYSPPLGGPNPDVRRCKEKPTVGAPSAPSPRPLRSILVINAERDRARERLPDSGEHAEIREPRARHKQLRGANRAGAVAMDESEQRVRAA